MEVIAPPELHLMEGVFHHIYFKLLPTLDNDQKELLNKSLRNKNIYPSRYHGGKYEGNEVRKILKSADMFLSPFVSTEYQHQLLDSLIKFDKVVHSCFATKLIPDYVTHIGNFQQSFILTGLSVTYKVHVVVSHIIDFINHYAEPGKGLGLVSEQAGESAHHKWIKYWEKFKLRMDHPQYPERLELCLQDFTYDRLPI